MAGYLSEGHGALSMSMHLSRISADPHASPLLCDKNPKESKELSIEQVG